MLFCFQGGFIVTPWTLPGYGPWLYPWCSMCHDFDQMCQENGSNHSTYWVMDSALFIACFTLCCLHIFIFSLFFHLVSRSKKRPNKPNKPNKNTKLNITTPTPAFSESDGKLSWYVWLIAWVLVLIYCFGVCIIWPL